jgi:hypothetical protein
VWRWHQVAIMGPWPSSLSGDKWKKQERITELLGKSHFVSTGADSWVDGFNVMFDPLVVWTFQQVVVVTWINPGGFNLELFGAVCW